MTWLEALPAITGCIYAIAGVGYGLRGEYGFSLAYAAYAVANVGIIWATVAGRN